MESWSTPSSEPWRLACLNVSSGACCCLGALPVMPCSLLATATALMRVHACCCPPPLCRNQMRLATDSHPIMLAEPSFNRWGHCC